MKYITKYYFELFLILFITNISLYSQSGYMMNFQNLDYMSHGDFIYCGSPDYSFTDKLTVAAWVKWTTDPQSFAVTPANHEREGQYSTYIAYTSHNSEDNGQFWLRNSKTANKFEFLVQNTSGTIATATSTSNPAEDTWFFVTGVYNGTNVKLYIDGNLEKTVNLTGNIKTNDGTHRLNMGRLPWGYGFFVGYMDEVRIWKAELSQEEISQQMNSASSVNSANMVSYWDFDEGTGTIIDDSGTQNADGVFYTCLIDVHGISTSPYILYDYDKTWGIDAWQNCPIKTVSGAGVDETNTVSSNTAVACTLSNAWSTTPITDGTENMSWFGVQKNAETSQWVVSDNPLPVELGMFSANVIKNKVALTWETATEKNNYGFEIERAVLEGDKSFEIIGFVEGNGNSNSLKTYSFIDSNPVDGKAVYRLKQIDYDGKYEYSKEIEVVYEAVKEFALEQNYPNPFNPTTNISFKLAESGKVSVKIFNAIGQEVAELVNRTMEAGRHEVTFNASELPSGAYFCRMRSGNFTKTSKMLLIK